MIEQKLIVGRYIELQTPAPANALTPMPAGFQLLNRFVLHIEQSKSSASPVAPPNPLVGFNPTLGQSVQILAQRAGQHIESQFDRQRVSGTAAGAVAKAHRNFVWLEWLAGLVSAVEPNGVDVLTGPMSGCWIMSFLYNGTRYVGHVGTDMTPTTANSIAAKAAWNNFATGAVAGGGPGAVITGFNPFNDWVLPYPAGLPGEANLKMFALVTAANTFHSVATFPQLNKIHRLRIAGIQNLPSSIPAPTFHI
jgi:hypothetical protein